MILHIGKVDIVHPDGKAILCVLLQLAAVGDVDFPGQLYQFPDPVSGNRAVEEVGDDHDHVVKGRREAAPLGQEEGHGTIGNGTRP